LCYLLKVAPSEVVAQQTIRKAMGISHEPSSTDAAVETQNAAMSVVVSQPSSNKQQELDAEINDFFAQGSASQPIVL